LGFSAQNAVDKTDYWRILAMGTETDMRGLTIQLGLFIAGLTFLGNPVYATTEASSSATGDVSAVTLSSPSISSGIPTLPSRVETPSFINRVARVPESPILSRLAVWGGLSLAQGVLAYRKTLDIWGKPSGKFHLKNDLNGDYLACSDEISHMLVAYKLAQLARQGFRWSGLSPAAATRWGAFQAAVYMTFVEFPMDAYNPGQGMGLSDLLADFAGIGLAWCRAGVDNPRWDLKVSVKSEFFAGNSRLLAHNNKQYDDFIYWLTYRISDNRYNPLVIGLGYSTYHPPGDPPTFIPVDKQIYFRIGTSLAEVGRFFGRRTERLLSPAEVYFFNIGPRTGWR